MPLSENDETSTADEQKFEGSFTDITDLKRAEARLRESEERLLSFYTAAFEGIAITEKGKVIDFNDQFAETFGYTRTELLNKNVSDLVEEEDRERVSRLNQAGYDKPYEHKALHKDGSIVFVQVNGREIQYQGRKARVTAVHDITERKIAEQALKESEERLSLVLDVSKLGFFDFDIESGAIVRNQRAAEIFGDSIDNLKGSQNWWEERIHPADSKRVIDRYDGYIAGVTDRFNTEFRVRHTNGEYRNIHSVGKIVRRDKEGRPLRFIGTLEDITDQIKTQELMVQTEKMMSIGGLAAGIAHEINNPLGAILQGTQNVIRRLSAQFDKNKVVAEKHQLNLESLEAYMKDRSIDTFLQGIRESAQKAAEIIRNMLQYTRRSESHMAPNDIKTILRQAVNLACNDYNLKKKYDFRNIEIIEEYDTTLNSVPCTETEIEQVIFNLLTNSAHALMNCSEQSESPKIILRTVREEEMVKIEVEDNGPGMDQETRNRLFEPFYTTKPVGEGTGLGLSVSYMIVTHNHQGSMKVDSDLRRGTKFTIRIPLERPALETSGEVGEPAVQGILPNL